MGWAFVYRNQSDFATVYAQRTKQRAQAAGFTKGRIQASYLKGCIHRQRGEFEQALASVLVLLAHEFGDKITVKREFGDLPQIRCFPNQLNQVFLSLLTNATQAIEATGTITIKTSLQKDRVQIDIMDTGRGIPPEKLSSLFNFGFTSADKRVKMGSGLMMANNIIRRHGGEIKVTSEVGKGSTFTLLLPLTHPEGDNSH